MLNQDDLATFRLSVRSDVIGHGRLLPPLTTTSTAK